MRNTATLNASAIGLSGLCLIHCLALPVLAAVSPLAGLLAEAEWLHRALVLMAAPITLYAITRDRTAKVGPAFTLFAGVGLATLLAAAFIEALHDFETVLTTLGAGLLAGAHLWRWHRHSRFL